MASTTWPLMPNIITLRDKFELIKFILSTNYFTAGKKVEQFEQEWSTWLGSKHSLFVSSGSTANFLLISAVMELYGIKRGDKVLLPACTWMTNVAPVMQLGLTPVFCDINLDNFSFNEQDLERISQIHPDIKIIFVTHLLGFPANNNKYQRLFPNAIILDDVCESHGCKLENGIRVGTNSVGATFSFYFGHHMTTIEGGMVSTNNTDLYDLMKMKRSHGMARHSSRFEEYAKKYDSIEKSFLFITDGYNFRNTELSAVLGISQLKHLDQHIAIRQNNFKLFTEIVAKYPHLIYPITYTKFNSSFSLPLIARSKDVYDSLKHKLRENGIEFRPIVGGNLLKQPFLSGYEFAVRKDSYEADLLHTLGVYVGNNQHVTENQLEVLDNILNSISYE